MAAIDELDSSAVRRWCAAAVSALEARRGEIDDLNVYPVPDGDTGTNMLLTLRAADEAVRAELAGDLAGTVGAMARGAVLGARGNSGVIVSQVLRGVAEGLADGAGAAGTALAAALARGAELAWGAVGDPVEGTMLSVARAAAESAAGAGDELAAVARSAVEGAAGALQLTPSQLPMLARAGVVDAGGRGLVVLLEALAGVVGAAAAGGGSRRVARDSAVAGGGAGERVGRLLRTRCSTCSRPATRPSRRCGTSWPRSATRWSWSAPGTAAGPCTCTSTTWARRSRPASRPAGRTGSR